MAKNRFKLVLGIDESDDKKTTQLFYISDCEFGVKITDNNPKLKWKPIAEFMDRNCEDRNNHSMTGVHERLGKLLVKLIGAKRTGKIMRVIAEQGGLDLLEGI